MAIDGLVNIVTVLVKCDPNDQRLRSVATKESPLNRRVSRTDTENDVERSGSNDAEDTNNVSSQSFIGKASTADVARELNCLLSLRKQVYGNAPKNHAPRTVHLGMGCRAFPTGLFSSLLVGL